MKRLTKYLIIVYSILAILLTTSYISNEIFIKNALGPRTAARITLYIANELLIMGTFFGFPLLIIFISALYLIKEGKSKKAFEKSLIIPSSYCVIGIISSLIWGVGFASGHRGMLVILLWAQFFITIFLSLICNWIILKFSKNNSYNPEVAKSAN